MYNKFSAFRQSKMKVLAVLVSALVVSACAAPPAAAPAAPAVTEAPTEAKPTEAPVATAAPVASPTEITLLIAADDVSQMQIQNQVENLNKENPKLNLKVDYVRDFSTYRAHILTEIASGSPHDIVAVPAQWLQNELGPKLSVTAIDEGKLSNFGDFLDGALESNRFEGKLYGVPWIRSGCSAVYWSLALPTGSKHLDQAIDVINLLTASSQVQSNFTNDALRWFPPRKSANDLTAKCSDDSTNSAMIPLTNEQSKVLLESSAITKDIPDLQNYLRGKSFLPEGLEFRLDRLAISGDFDQANPTKLMAMAVPVGNILLPSADQLRQGVIIGSITLAQNNSIPGVPAGTYGVMVQSDPNDPNKIHVFLVDTQGNKIEVDPQHYRFAANTGHLPGITPTPFASSEKGTFRLCIYTALGRICFWQPPTT